jgi:hypothetical protein
VRGRDDEALARTLDYEAASASNLRSSSAPSAGIITPWFR